MRSKIIFTLISFALAIFSAGAQSSVLSQGLWYKIAVQKNGVYRISHEQFKKMGFDPSEIEPSAIKIFGLKGGMLPQANAVSSSALAELAIQVVGVDDAKFGSQDYVLFYGHGPDGVEFEPETSTFKVQPNLYSDKNYYFVTVGDTPGKRITSTPLATGGTLVNSFDDFIHHELDEHNELSSGREWYGEYFFINTQYNFDLDIPGIVEGSSIRFVSDVVSQSFSPTSMEIRMNNVSIGEQSLPKIFNSTYAAKGIHQRQTFLVDASSVGAASRSEQNVAYVFKKASSGTSRARLDFFQVNFERNLRLYRNQVLFRSLESLGDGSTRYQISNASASLQVWDVSEFHQPVKHILDINGDIAEFTAEDGQQLREYIAFNNEFPSVELVGKVENQNLSGSSTPALLIVTSKNLLPAAQRLGEYRSGRGVSTLVMTTEQIYNEFSSGRQDITAIRNMVRHFYDRSPGTLKAVLLFGKGSYDYKNRISNNTNIVPIYESRNSLTPLESYSSDDYYAMLETHEGEWTEGLDADNHTIDIGVGRLPVKTLNEGHSVIDKIIQYENNPSMLGDWRKRVVFVADDGSNLDDFSSLHQSQANILAESIENDKPSFNTQKIFLGTYVKTVTPVGETIPKASEDILEEFNNALIINYTGHGSEKVLADEDVVTRELILRLKNKNYPFLVTATCEFGRHDDPEVVSSAEECILLPGAGAIGMVTTARSVNSGTNFFLNQAFYDALFSKESNLYPTLGEVFVQTKNESMSGVANRNFSMLADPMMRLALPPLDIHVTSCKTLSGSDTLKALSTVVVTGEIREGDGSLAAGFNGVVQTTLFDKRTKFKTIGRNDPAFSFDEWHNPLFHGKASVSNGVFQIQFVLPKNIAYEINVGKLSLYAADYNTGRDATGSSGSFKIGGSEPAITPDHTSPIIMAYMGDSTFIDGGIVQANSTLVVRLEDENGINISNYGIGNTLMAILDDDEVYLLNEHFTADKDTYKAGWVTYPLYNLPPGKHTFTVKGWDTHNNPAQATVSFVVGEQSELAIETFGNFPNPFSRETTLFFRHNRPGEVLVGEITLMNTAGQEIHRISIPEANSTYEVRINLADLESGRKKLPPGLYFARVEVRSISDGSKSGRVTKLIVVN